MHSEWAVIEILLVSMVAGALKAVQDTVRHHWQISVFTHIRPQWLRKWIFSAWQNAYYSWPTDKRKRPVARYFPMVQDCWHACDSARNVLLILLAVHMLYVQPDFHTTAPALVAVYAIAMFVATFVLLYDFLLIIPEHRGN